MQRLRERTEDFGVAVVRGRGLMVGVVLARLDTDTEQGAESRALAVGQRLLRSGWIVLTGGRRGDVLTLTPPLTIDESLLDAFVGALVEALATR